MNSQGIKNIGEISQIKFSEEEIRKPLSRSQYTENKIKEFYQQALELTKSQGFEGRLSKKNWMYLEKDNKKFTIQYSPFFSDGIDLKRITSLEANNAFTQETLCHFMVDWWQACEDEQTQKDIDVIVASIR